MIVKLKVVTGVKLHHKGRRVRSREVDRRKQTASNSEKEKRTGKEVEGEKLDEVE
jgi:hypothetical protein